MALHKCLLISPHYNTRTSNLYWCKLRITSENIEETSDLLSQHELLLSWCNVFVRDIQSLCSTHLQNSPLSCLEKSSPFETLPWQKLQDIVNHVLPRFSKGITQQLLDPTEHRNNFKISDMPRDVDLSGAFWRFAWFQNVVDWLWLGSRCPLSPVSPLPSCTGERRYDQTFEDWDNGRGTLHQPWQHSQNIIFRIQNVTFSWCLCDQVKSSGREIRQKSWDIHKKFQYQFNEDKWKFKMQYQLN